MINEPLLDNAYALRGKGKFKEAFDAFCRIAERTDIPLEKAGVLLSATEALVGLGDNNAAKKYLDDVKELLALCTAKHVADSDREDLLRLKIGVALQETIVSATEERKQEALKAYAALLVKYKAELRRPTFRDLYETIQGERAFLLADLGSFEDALPRLEELELSQSQNSSILFYLGYCYLMTRDYSRAQRKLEAAIALGLLPHFGFRAHCALGMSFYLQQDYPSAKRELEKGARTATPRFLKEAEIWKWLAYSCQGLGQNEEAERYARMARPS